MATQADPGGHYFVDPIYIPTLPRDNQVGQNAKFLLTSVQHKLYALLAHPDNPTRSKKVKNNDFTIFPMVIQFFFTSSQT